MSSDALADVGTAAQHLSELQSYWTGGLVALEERMKESNTVYQSDKDNHTILVATLRLLGEYKAPYVSAEGTRYTHLAALYETWREAQGLSATIMSTKSKTLTKELEGATNLLYNRLFEGTTTYTLARLVNIG
jgi:hypothetical protein